jgi:hypothetical protein
MLKVQTNSRQIPSIKQYTADKKYSDLIYGVLQEMSDVEEIDGVKKRFVDKKQVSFASLESRLGIARQTISTKFKNLIKLGLIEEDAAAKRYWLKYLDKSICSLVPFETLRKLNNTLSNNAISLFVYLLNRYIANGEKEYCATMAQMKEFIGIATSTTSNNDVINDILQVLTLLGLMKTEIRMMEGKTYIFVVWMSNTVKEVTVVKKFL